MSQKLVLFVINSRRASHYLTHYCLTYCIFTTMTIFQKKFYTAILLVTAFSLQGVFAFQPQATSRYFNGPTVTSVSSTSAELSLSSSVLADIPDEEKSGVYFQYYETHQMCIMIYPTPEYCLPKKTDIGKTNIMINNLKPSTSYTVLYKRDNTIRCITTPCPSNEFQSLSVEFTTKSQTGDTSPSDNIQITKNLFIGSRGSQVITLQTVLIQQGYMQGSPTGYFGFVTFKAVKKFQKAHDIPSTGYVGPRTRTVLLSMTVSSLDTSGVAEIFEGTVTAYSTACFSDGECSITVDGKKVVTTVGWSQMIVGRVIGVPDFGSIESKVGSHAKVYAKKVSNGYTLYGNANYYIVLE